MLEQKKIKIAYQIAPHVRGGAESFLFNLIKNIDKKKFQPVLLSFAKGIVLKKFKKLGLKIKIIDYRNNAGSNKLINFLKKEKIDIAQTSSFFPALAIVSKKSGIPHIWRISGNVNITCSDQNLKAREDILQLIDCLSVAIVCPSIFLKNQFVGYSHKKITIIYNGLDLDYIKNIRPDKKKLRNIGINETDIVVGMAANLNSQKRHIDFIKAAEIVRKEIKNIKFILAGSKSSGKKGYEYMDYLKKEIRKSELNNDVIFTGFREDILKIIASLDLTVLPSINEGASNFIMESIALGKPVVATNSGGNPEFIQDKINGFLVPIKNPKKLAKAIIKIIKNPANAGKMRAANKNLSKKMFNIKKTVTIYEKLYKKIYKKSSKF